MDHPNSLSRDLPELPWRTTALVASAVAALELLVLVSVAFVFLVKPLVTGGGAPAKPLAREKTAAPAASGGGAPAEAPAVAKLERNATSVMVLNGNGSSGAASEKADLVRTRGYIITGTGNAPRTNFARSIVMYRPGYRGEAERLGRDFGVKRVAPLDGLSRADLGGAHLALIVGAS